MKPVRVKYADLETKAKEIYDKAGELAESMASEAAIGKMLDVQIKAIRLQAELREKGIRPDYLLALEHQCKLIESKLSAHHAGNIDRSGTQAPRQDSRPNWEQ